MSSPQRDSRLYAIKEHALAEIQLLKEEINIFLDNPVFVSGRITLDDVTNMLERISVQKGVIDVIEKEFKS
jgi:hypothetical protein